MSQRGNVSARKLFEVLPGIGNIVVPNPQDFVEWNDPAARQPTELELFAYPLAPNEFSAYAVTTKLFGVIGFELQTSQGTPDGKGGGVGIWETSDLVQGNGIYNQNFFIPAHGLRMRFACVAARLRVCWCSVPTTFAMFASFTPCRGSESQSVPPQVLFPNAVTVGGVPQPQAIPKGAREMRARSQTQQDWLSYVVFYTYEGALIGLLGQSQVSTYQEFRPIPLNAFFVHASRVRITSDGDFGPAFNSAQVELEFR